MVVEVVVVSTPSLEEGEWTTMIPILPELVDLIALLMVNDKHEDQLSFILLYVHVP